MFTGILTLLAYISICKCGVSEYEIALPSMRVGGQLDLSIDTFDLVEIFDKNLNDDDFSKGLKEIVIEELRFTYSGLGNDVINEKIRILESDNYNILNEVTQLVLRKKNLTEIPAEVFKLVNLEKLFLDYNNINKIPEEIKNLSNLKELSLSGNNITEIPDIIFELTNLEGLYLYENSIAEIPEEIENLSNLKKLSFGYNSISKIPEKSKN